MTTEHRDCVVIGGGPTGSTFAAIVKKYAPHKTVTVLEAARFPRYHVGESMLPVANVILRDLEVEPSAFDGRFIRKYGVRFVWGKERASWTASYQEIGRLYERGTENGGATDQNLEDFLRREGGGSDLAINVRRAEFDDMLLKNAGRFGAEVREGTRVTKVLKDASGRVEGVAWEDDTGATGTIETPFVLDACGLGGMLTRNQREYDANLANFAVHGYVSGAKWKVAVKDDEYGSIVFIPSIDHGWVWFIPVDKDVVSVGVVTNTKHLKERLKELEPEEFFWESIRSCKELADSIEDAHLLDNVLPGGRRVACVRDWSSWAKTPVGPGWAAAGDAAIFIDPLLSSGLTVALMSGHRAAYTYVTADAHPELPEQDLWQAYADYIRGEAGAYLMLVRYFYANHSAGDSQFWERQRSVNAASRLNLGDREVFTMATAGFFPVPQTLGIKIVAEMIKSVTGTQADLLRITKDDGIPSVTELGEASYHVRAPFHLALRTTSHRDPGKLAVFYDLVTDEFDFAHRLDAASVSLHEDVGPIVEAVHRHSTVADLLQEMTRNMAASEVSEAELRERVLSVVAVAVQKGYVGIGASPSRTELGREAS